MFLPHPLVKLSIVGSLCDREVACSVSDLQGLNFKSRVGRAVSSQHPQEVHLAQLSMFVHTSGQSVKPDSFHFIFYPGAFIGFDKNVDANFTITALKRMQISVVSIFYLPSPSLCDLNLLDPGLN